MHLLGNDLVKLVLSINPIVLDSLLDQILLIFALVGYPSDIRAVIEGLRPIYLRLALLQIIHLEQGGSNRLSLLSPERYLVRVSDVEKQETALVADSYVKKCQEEHHHNYDLKDYGFVYRLQHKLDTLNLLLGSDPPSLFFLNLLIRLFGDNHLLISLLYLYLLPFLKRQRKHIFFKALLLLKGVDLLNRCHVLLDP